MRPALAFHDNLQVKGHGWGFRHPHLLRATGLVGFYAFDNRTVKPTGRLIFFALSRIRYLSAHDGSPPKILIPEQIQVRLLELLKIDPAQPR
ncbi:MULTISPECIES: hypothetical protein [Streptomyces]|uniref:Uncharacterized protein n=1 Tax=Streptomyces dengpaensis TaxID=2049881 RepID=A0ABN5HUB3_9ACTN|nr:MULTISPECIES: hypothetical protein [Streptomyces]AVH54509.1 hypothetical protein C4B68_00125 [Streptomyces dengpaensis]